MAASKPKMEKDNSERWLLTYADLMNLLLIFFIILYTMSQTDQAKFEQLAQSLREAFGDRGVGAIMQSGGAGVSLIPLPAVSPSNVIPSSLEEQQMDEVEKKVNELIEKNNLTGDVQVAMEERGIRISITAQLLFKSGSAEIEAVSRPTIQEIGKILLEVSGNHIRVEGHTDTDPIQTSQFPSNWELSSARATNVLRQLVDAAGLDPKKISAVGYGEFAPKLPNTTPENKAANRRVDIIIMKSIFDKAEAGKSKPIESNQSKPVVEPAGSKPGSTNAPSNPQDVIKH